MDLLDLSRHLKQEQLFVTSQRSQIQKLYEDVKKEAEELYHESWIVRQQRGCLDSLLTSAQNCTPKDCYAKVNQLEWTNFIDSYKQLSYHESKYTEFLKFLRDNPTLLANLINHAEKSANEPVNRFIKLISCSVYGNIVLQEDEYLMGQMVKSLAELQLVPNSDPRRLLRRGSCAFSVAIKLMFETMYSVKLFLTAALHDPIMRLLMEDEWFYDIDPQKALHRFPPPERIKRFGEPNSENYDTKCQEYRKFIVDKLVVLSNRFITSIKNNIHCFPPTLAWIVSQVYHMLMKSGKFDLNKVRTVCADLVFSIFMCPVIIDPEPHGITSDVHISHIARHNLMQIAQIIQVLSLPQIDEEAREKDLYERFEKGCVSSLLDVILESASQDMMSFPAGGLAGLSRAAVLITVTQLNSLVFFLRSSLTELPDATPEKKLLEEHLTGLVTLLQSQNSTGGVNSPIVAPSTPPVTRTPPSTPGEKKKTPKCKRVLVVPLGIESECPGMLTETKVLSWEQENKPRRVKCPSVSGFEPVGNPIFPLQATLVTSKRPSRKLRPVTPSDPWIWRMMKITDDNFSDMISANVSGRGTPDISGRDTPLSQAGSVEEPPPPQMPIPDIPPLPETVKKTNRIDVTERFGKFEIKAELERDETKSTVSDTWSTDVLASDSEPPENQYDRLEEVVRQSLLIKQEHVSEVSETASDAWSMDVLASDTEEKQALSEFDQDDIGSVTDLASMSGDQAQADLPEGNHEETPLASGRQSPTEDQQDLLGATGMDSGPPAPYDNEPFIPRTSDSSLPGKSKHPRRPGRSIDNVFADNDEPVLSTRSQEIQISDANRLSIPVKQPRPHSAGRSGSHGRHGPLLSVPEHSSTVTSSKPVNSSTEILGPPPPLQNLEGNKPMMSFMPPNIGNIPVTSDVSKAGDNSLKKLESSDLQELENLSFENPVFNGGARPKQRSSCPQIGSRDKDFIRKENEQKKARSVIEWTASCSTDSGIGGTPHSLESQSMDSLLVQNDRSSQQSMDSFADQSGVLKISEQQNTNFNANRLSEALSMFDPYSSDSHTNVDTSSIRTDSSLFPHSESDRSSNEVWDPLLNSARDMGESRSKSDAPIFCPIPIKPSVPGPLNAATESLIQLGDRDSITSTNSTGSGNTSDGAPFAKSSRSASFDNISEGKDVVDGETDEKRKKGIFKSLKDRVSKESSDDILEKYRKKTVSDQATESLVVPTIDIPAIKEKRLSIRDDEIDGPPIYDPNNLENCFAFTDTKRKLRIVMSSPEFQIGYSQTPDLAIGSLGIRRDLDTHKDMSVEILKLLKAQLAEAINLQNKDLIAQLHEAIRCVKMFDSNGCKKLIRSLHDDYQSRTAYVSYLIRSQQGLLTTSSFLQRLVNRVKRDKAVCNNHLTQVCVRLYVERKEGNVIKFITDFQKLTMPDEKTDLVEKFLQYLYQNMYQDPIWQASNEAQLEDAQIAIERFIMSRIYTHAMFPNGDGDILRDQYVQQYFYYNFRMFRFDLNIHVTQELQRLFHQHIKKLSQIITPSHKDLRIPRMYQFECPWTAAQKELYMINAYKTPKDKVKCVTRCSTTIMNLLSMANERSVPAADDFLPVLIYVIIKANPPCMLSTNQYVNSFYGNRFSGEEQYWWIQFSSALEFIKTMEYNT
ncbi:hypothetical protein FSP39_019810 [Pinctada imbricata]|uniref:GTPase-activating protein and VPS9 domain-containing protein 1 n=1 Tax=Pinctada imbricata TaxID=66713 RepID=A0AA88Y394_PINIB|nr:hypothetical protein FSP39_019810 [Pinctada imbricata]